MDILTHSLSGLAVGTVFVGFSGGGVLRKTALLAVSAFAGALPDIDAISLWSGFDANLGSLFRLDNSGKEIYFSKYGYSHHGFMHSLVAALLFALFLGSIIYLLKSRFKNINLRNLIYYQSRYRWFLLTFVVAFCIHLLEDMPTPACVWGGVNFFWPASLYTGGTGDIWWWNNYDIFLIVVAVIILNMVLQLLPAFFKVDLRKFCGLVLLTGFIVIFIQIKSRSFDFNYTGHTVKYNEYEMKSKEIQKQILGIRVYNMMSGFDKRIPFNF